MNYNEILFQLSSKGLCRAIAWDAFVVGGNKQGGRLSVDSYVKAIYLGSIIRGQFSGGNYLGVIISSQVFGRAIV